MKIVLVQLGKTDEKYLVSGINKYLFRLDKMVKFEIITIPAIRNTKNMPVNEQKKQEGIKIRSSLKEGDYIILLDEKGDEYGSVDFSKEIQRLMNKGPKRIVFIIGGPYGFAEETRQLSKKRISLSKMTFSHQMVRLLFVEQLYRAFAIIKGIPYHHE